MSEKRWNSPRVCVTCGMKFIPKVSHTKNCGEICQEQYKKDQREKVKKHHLVQKDCVICGTTFETNLRSKTCSKTCSHELKKRRNRRKQVPKNCEVCGDVFTSIRSAKTCSPVCSEKRKIEMNRQGLYRKNNEPRPCKTCGKIFQPFNSKHLFCGRYCYESIERKPVRTVECARCGTIFQTTRGVQKYCTRTCMLEERTERERQKQRKLRGSAEHQTIKCSMCNTHFEQKHSRQVYCSPECNAEAGRKRSWQILQDSPIRSKTCLYCQESFKPKTRTSMAKFCSHKCRGAHQAARKQEKKDELQKERANFENLQRKWDDSSIQIKDCPADTAYAREIWAYLKKGKTITKYLNPIWAAGSVIDEDETELFEL